jgi:hypothetical protein
MGLLIYNHQPFRVYRSFHLAYFFKDQTVEEIDEDLIEEEPIELEIEGKKE